MVDNYEETVMLHRMG